MKGDVLAKCSKKMQISFPPGTRVLCDQDEAGMDSALSLKVEIPGDRWEAFLAGSPFRGKDFRSEARYLLGPDDGSWDPSRPSDLPTAQVRLMSGAYLNMGVDRTDPVKAVLYLFWHET